MSGRLTHVQQRATGAAADARWLTTGIVSATSPLTVTVSKGVPDLVMAGYVGDPPAPGDPVVVGILRGSPAVSYVVIGPHNARRAELINTAQGGTHGITATPANTGNASGDPFDLVVGDVTFDDTHGVLAYKITPTTVVTGGGTLGYPAYVQWSEPDIDGDGAPSWQCGGRFELYLPAYPPSLVVVADVLRHGGYDPFLWVNSSGALWLLESGMGAIALSPAATVPLNTWCRVEYAFDFTAGAGTYSVALYPTPAATTATWAASGAWAWTTGLSTGPDFGQGGIYEGHIFGSTSAPATMSFWIDNLKAIDRAELPGPA